MHSLAPQPKLSHTLQEATALLLPSSPSSSSSSAEPAGNCLPIWATLPADVLTPVIAYLRLTDGASGVESFLLESAVKGETAGRWSFVGANPEKVYRTGPNEDVSGDPLVPLEKVLDGYKFIQVQGAPPLTGGAVGYVGYDCMRYFEPKTARDDLSDPVGIPESVFLLHDTVVAFDHLFQRVYVVSHVYLPSTASAAGSDAREAVRASYDTAVSKIKAVAAKVTASTPLPLPRQPPIVPAAIPAGETTQERYERLDKLSNVGKDGYERFVTSLKDKIVQGEIIQAVPSQRLRRETKLHPFNVYRHLRQLNPSPYMFYIECGKGTQLVGASPECLCKVEEDGKVTNHAIAGTVRRGKTPAEDAALAAELSASVKDRAEHVMLVDLARNDINRVCKPETVVVDSLMQVEKFSHVMHLTSQVSGRLREGLTRFDAFRSIFPAGTVSGAPKIRAIELIAALERERRGVYAGAVGHIDFSRGMDTCIAIRTMVFRDGVAYLQAGGGIVFDSVEEDEYVETVNKLGANVRCLEEAEAYYAALQAEEGVQA
ncbi:putative TRP2-anthranilate synthase component I [Rhodotorula diobovata]|uniref:anthranilate synthase n=1 Tax=Rhodotorula diobovata TaxID=5288 RepID=A0A5C5FVG8_9BASI|nr:putative TRP2-anthranilate synthase component I [Rhodotorula diobovata]